MSLLHSTLVSFRLTREFLFYSHTIDKCTCSFYEARHHQRLPTQRCTIFPFQTRVNSFLLHLLPLCRTTPFRFSVVWNLKHWLHWFGTNLADTTTSFMAIIQRLVPFFLNYFLLLVAHSAAFIFHNSYI